MLTTFLQYCGITASITTNWDVYNEFIGLYLKHFVASTIEKPDLCIHSIFPLTPEDQPVPPPFSREDLRKVGQNIYFSENCLFHQSRSRNIYVYFNKDDSILIHCEDNMWLPKSGGIRTAARNILSRVRPLKKTDIYGAFQTHMRLTFHYPLFWLLEALRGFHLLHATAVSINGTGIIFCGLASTGKTTLSTFLYFNHPGTDLLTDNFLPYDDEHIYAFPEASRLDVQGMDIASARSSLTDSFQLGHRLHWVARKPDPLGSTPRKAFLLCLGENLKVESISTEFFVDTAIGLNDVVKEFHNYSYVGLFPFATGRPPGVYEARVPSLKSCLQNTDCALLTIPNVVSLKDIKQDLLSIIQ